MNPETVTIMNQAMGVAGAVACLGLSATGSAFGTGFAGGACALDHAVPVRVGLDHGHQRGPRRLVGEQSAPSAGVALL